MLSDSSTMVRKAAAYVLATSVPKYGYYSYKLMNRTLATDSDVRVRRNVANAVVHAVNDLGENATGLIMDLLLDKDELVRELGVRAVDVVWHQSGGRKAGMRFANKVVRDNYEHVRRAFAAGPLGTATDMYGEKTAWMFSELMADRSTDVRNAAAQTLAAKIEGRSAAGIAIFQRVINESCEDYHAVGTLTRDERGPECPIAAMAAGKPLAAAVEIMGSDATPFLRQALKRKEPGVREMAAGTPLFLTLKNMTYEEALAWIIPVVNDTDEKVRAAAGQASAWVQKLAMEEQMMKLHEALMAASENAKEAERERKVAQEALGHAEAATAKTQAALEEAVLEKMKAHISEQERERTEKALHEKSMMLEDNLLQVRVKEAGMKSQISMAVMEAVNKEK